MASSAPTEAVNAGNQQNVDLDDKLGQGLAVIWWKNARRPRNTTLRVAGGVLLSAGWPLIQ